MPEFNVIKCVSCLVFQVGAQQRVTNHAPCAVLAIDEGLEGAQTSHAVPPPLFDLAEQGNLLSLSAGTASQEGSEVGLPEMRSQADAPKGRQLLAGNSGPNVPYMVADCMEMEMPRNPQSPRSVRTAPEQCLRF